jgi:hypothetical protein
MTMNKSIPLLFAISLLIPAFSVQAECQLPSNSLQTACQQVEKEQAAAKDALTRVYKDAANTVRIEQTPSTPNMPSLTTANPAQTAPPANQASTSSGDKPNIFSTQSGTNQANIFQ